MSYTDREAEELLEARRNRCIVKMQFVRPLAGGLAATDEGLRAFIAHHLGLTGEAAEQAFLRLKAEEIGERDTTPSEGELKTEAVYQVNVIRRSDKGPFILEHMLKACFKVAASRLGYFMKQRGTKGDIAELGTFRACGASLQKPDRPWEIYLRKNGAPALTTFQTLSGSVSTPQGKMSIKHETEVAEEGAEFEFELRWPKGKLGEEDVVTCLGAMREIGLGSCLSLGYGRMKLVEAEFEKQA